MPGAQPSAQGGLSVCLCVYECMSNNHVCMYLYVCFGMSANIRMGICTHKFVCGCVSISVFGCVCVCVNIFEYVCVCVHMHQV